MTRIRKEIFRQARFVECYLFLSGIGNKKTEVVEYKFFSLNVRNQSRTQQRNSLTQKGPVVVLEVKEGHVIKT